MSFVEVDAINYIVMSVGSCEPLEWAYQREDSRTEYTKLYKVKGMVIMSKDVDTIASVDELVDVAKDAKEVEVVIDTSVNKNTIIMVQEVLSHGATSVGTYLSVTPVKNEEGEAKYTGVVLGNTPEGAVQIYTLKGDAGYPEIWTILSGLTIGESVDSRSDGVKLGGALRFIAKDSNIQEESIRGEKKTLTHIDVVNKYV